MLLNAQLNALYLFQTNKKILKTLKCITVTFCTFVRMKPRTKIPTLDSWHFACFQLLVSCLE